MQDRVYANNPNYLQEMKDNIQMTITNITKTSAPSRVNKYF